jgi:hypothetical protein
LLIITDEASVVIDEAQGKQIETFEGSNVAWTRGSGLILPDYVYYTLADGQLYQLNVAERKYARLTDLNQPPAN